MTRRLILFFTIGFWIIVGGFWLGPLMWVPPLGARDAARLITPDELARHGSAQSCWMAIHGKVYDVTGYLPDHPSRPEVLMPWCGKEASQAYASKMRNRRHSAYADGLLARYGIGDYMNAEASPGGR